MRLRDVVGHGIYQSAQAMLTRAMEGESTAFDRLVPGANGVRRWMTIRVVPDASPSGEVHGAFVLMNDIHGLKQAQEALRDSEAALRLIMDNVPARVSYIDRDYRYRFLNRHNEEWLGESRKELTGRTFAEVVGNERANQLGPLLDRVLTGETVSTEKQLVQPDGQERWESVHYAPHRDAEGNVVGIYAVHADIHDQKRNEDELKRVNWMLSSPHQQHAARGARVGPRLPARALVAAGGEHLRLAERRDPRHSARRQPAACTRTTARPSRASSARLMGGEEPRATGLTRNHRRDGNTIWCEWYHSALLDDDGQIVSILSFVQDVSSRIQAEERLQYLATRDALTGLPNRLLLHERLSQAIAQAKRSGHRVGVLFIDLDRFKNVNDTLGHRIGDELLKRVTASLSGALRETDLLARLGGDEFMVIVEDFDDPSVLGRIAQKLLDAIAQPFEIEEHDIFVTSSIGIAVYPDDSDNPEELLKYADVAMYRSQGPRPQHVPVPRREPRRGPAAPAHARDGAAHGARRQRAAAALPAGGADQRPRDRRRRGAAALERSRARQRAAAGVHSARRGIGPHPRARRVGAALGCAAVRRMAQGRAEAHRVGEPVGAPVLPRGPRAAHLGNREGRGVRPVVDRARGDGDEPAARPRRHPQGAAPAARRRLHGGDRRLRHRATRR